VIAFNALSTKELGQPQIRKFTNTIFSTPKLSNICGLLVDVTLPNSFSPLSLPPLHKRAASLSSLHSCRTFHQLCKLPVLHHPVSLSHPGLAEIFTASMAGSNSPVAIKCDISKLQEEMQQKRIQSQLLRLNNEFGVLNLADGDTLAYIGPPPQTLSESQTWDYGYIRNHFSYPHRVRSAKFLDLNSKKFNDLFGPRSMRTERRFRKEGILSGVSTTGIKFFVDLRPPTEDEEAVVLLTSLTCTKGVLTWHTAQEKYGLPPLLVAGQDDSASIPVDYDLPVTTPKDKNDSKDHKTSQAKTPSGVSEEQSEPSLEQKSDSEMVQDAEGLNGPRDDAGLPSAKGASPGQPAVPIVMTGLSSPNSSKKLKAATAQESKQPVQISPEYTPLRHRSAIERVIQAIENGDPKLDSAPKMWTFFAVAKYFDCAAHERISGWITKWLVSYPNSNFIQSNPEVALRIGLGTQSESTTKDAFAILVGEKSLINVYGESNPTFLTPLVESVHGRRLELLDDDERNRIDHAAASLVRRIRQKFDDLVGEEMAWLQRSALYKRISSTVPQNQEEADLIKKLLQKTKNFVRGRIIWVLCRTYEIDFSDFDQALKNVCTFYPGTRDTFKETYNRLNERERIFTRFFWTALDREHLEDGAINLWTERNDRSGLPFSSTTYLSQKMLDSYMASGERKCQIVSRKEVDTLILQFNQIGRSRGPVNWQTENQPISHTEHDQEEGFINKHEVHGQLGNYSNTTQSENPAVRTYGDFNDFKSLSATSPKRDQPAVMSTQLTEKRRKLSDTNTDAGLALATSSTFKFPIRLGGRKFTQRDGDTFDQAKKPAQDLNLETPAEHSVSLCSGSATIANEGPEENSIPLYPKLPEVLALPAGEATTPSVAEEFGHDSFRRRNFQPILPKLPSSGFSMKEGNFRQRITDMSREPNFVPDHNDTSQSMTSDGSTQGRVITAADYSYGADDDKPGRVVTAADWSLQADDFDWNRPKVMQQFSNYESAQAIPCQRGDLRYTQLLHDIACVLRQICDEILNPPHLFHGEHRLPTDLIDTVMCLNDDEWKYLPLWAGGNDDDTGGVFDEVDVPNLEAGGFKGGKRGIYSAGDNSASSSVSGSSFDDIGSDAISTIGKASKVATDGTQTVKSLSDIGSEDEGFMKQNELWEEIRKVNVVEAGPVEHGADKGKARVENFSDGMDDGMDEDEDEIDTVVGAGLSDDGHELMENIEDGDDMNAAFDDGNDEDDMEIVNVDDL
jgi:hypothetical protein